MAIDSSFPFCMAKRVDGITSITSLALLIFMLLLVMANLDDDPSYGVLNPKRRKLSDFSSFTTRAAGGDNNSSREMYNSTSNGVRFSPIGRRGGKHHHFSWRDYRYVFNASAHEVPSGPNPISNR